MSRIPMHFLKLTEEGELKFNVAEPPYSEQPEYLLYHKETGHFLIASWSESDSGKDLFYSLYHELVLEPEEVLVFELPEISDEQKTSEST